MTASGPVIKGTYCLLTHTGYAVEMVKSIIRETNVDPCAEQEMEDLGASGLFDLSRVCSLRQLYFIIYLLPDGCNSFSGTSAYEGPAQDRCLIKEGVISCLRKHNKTLTNEQDQYKDAFCTLNKEVRDLNEKLKEETHQREKAEKAKASMEKELMAHFKQVEMARTDAIMEYKASQPFNDACTVYYGEGFDDCLKQVGSVYPDLDFSRVNMDKPLPTPLVKRLTSLFMPSKV